MFDVLLLQPLYNFIVYEVVFGFCIQDALKLRGVIISQSVIIKQSIKFIVIGIDSVSISGEMISRLSDINFGTVDVAEIMRLL